MLNMKSVFTISALLLCTMVLHKSSAEVLELDEDEEGTPVWKSGQYRDRNEIPLPPNFDEERKHRRDISDNEQEPDVKSQTHKKNLINRVHFSMPFGVDLPVYHISKGKKGKKNKVPQGFEKYTPNTLKLSEQSEYAKLDIQRPDRKSSVSKSWGMTYDNLFPDNQKAQSGQLRSKLEGGYKLSEEDLDSGMMFRGLGGLMLRDQNHQIIQSKFAEQEGSDEEMNARSDVSARPLEKKGLFHFSHIFNPFGHHHHRPHHHHFKPTPARKVTESQHGADTSQQQQQLQGQQQQQQR